MRSLIAFLFGFVVSSPGAVILWTNTAGGSWSVAANWRPNQVPGPDDIAEITAEGTYTVRLNTNAAIAGLTIGGAPGTQTFNHNGNILTLQGTCEVRSNGVYALAGGTLAGANTLVGQLTWSMGSLAADSAVAISSGSLVRITGSSNKYAYGALANAGTVIVEGSGTINLTEASRIDNLPGAVFDVRSYGGLTTPAGPRSIFHNEGTFRKTMYSGSFLFSNTTFDNDGAVEIESGKLRIGYGGQGWGTFELSTATELAFDGGYTGLSGSGFSGNGRITATGGDVVLDGDAGMSGVEWAGGTLGGTNRLTGSWSWSAGSFATNSAVAISSGSLVRITGSSNKSVYGALANAGTVIVEGSGTISLTEVSRIHNLPGALFEARSYGGLSVSGGSRALFHNEGTFRKTAYTGSFQCLNTAFDNDGIVQVESGTLRIGYGGRGWGTFELSASTELAFDGGYTGLSGSGFSGNGRITALGGEVVLDGEVGMSGIEWAVGTLGGTNRLTGSWSWSAGGLATNSAIAISSNSVVRITGSSGKSIWGALTNEGTVVVEGSGTIYLTEASRIHNLAGALFEVRSYGGFYVGPTSRAAFHNEGTFRKTDHSGSFYCFNTTFDNDGIVEVESGTLRIGYGGRGRGAFELSASTELAFDGGYTGLSGSRFSGDGPSTAMSGDVVLDGEVGMSGIEWAGGTLGGTNRLTGSWSWSAGFLATNSAIAISSGSLVRITGSDGKYVSGSLANAGIITVEGAGPIYLTATSRIDNLAGAVFEMQGSGGVAVLGISWPVFQNAGVFRKTLYSGTLNLSGLNFTGDGTVEIQSGQLTLGESYANQAGDIVLAGGAIQLVPQGLLATSGRLSGYGTVIASVVSSGTVAPVGTNGILAIQGDYTQLIEGTIEFEVGGPGASMDHSRLQVTGHAFLNGSIGVRTAPGWVPEPGAAYPVISSLSSEGALACFNGFFLLGQNLRLAPVSAPNSLSLVVVAAPDPPGPFMSILQADRILVCWPGEFAGFELQRNAGLDPAHWLSIPGVSHRYFETNMVPRQFFRLFKPATAPPDPG